jgi:hypothetical protein
MRGVRGVQLRTQPSVRDSEPWRTYAELAWSAAATPTALLDVIAWNRDNAKMMRLGMLSGTGSDASGNSLMSFTGIGWGYGLLLADDAETFLLQLFTAAAHANTRGSWTAPEETDIGGGAMPYASSSQLLMPVNLRWMLAWEHPLTNRTLWIARATPRAWLSEGEVIALTDAPTSFGRLSYRITSAIDSRRCVIVDHVGLVRAHSGSAPLTDAVVRLRTPGHRTIVSVKANGAELPASRWSLAEETVSFPPSHVAELTAGPIEVCYGAAKR